MESGVCVCKGEQEGVKWRMVCVCKGEQEGVKWRVVCVCARVNRRE